MSNKKYVLFGITITIICASIGYWYYITVPMIYTYKDSRDRNFILRMYRDNWYMLIAAGSDFSPVHMLTYRASSQNPKHLGNQIIKVMYKGNTPVGFTAYHKKSFYQGKVHFVLIDKPFRGHGYGLQIVRYAINDLKALGCTEISLVTRVENYAAQKTYKNAGFMENGVEDGFMYFKYTVAK
jgi:ribosomal protein S18 acetylase RimI-like enzyme